MPTSSRRAARLGRRETPRSRARRELPRRHPGLGADLIAELDLREVVELVTAHDEDAADLRVLGVIPSEVRRMRERDLEDPAQIDLIRDVAELVDICRRDVDRLRETDGHLAR
jgi:hypothetical protein